jgi:hypothetical protein
MLLLPLEYTKLMVNIMLIISGERLLPPKEGLPFEQPDWEGKR